VRDLPLNRCRNLFRVMGHIHHVRPTLAAKLSAPHIHHGHAQVARLADAGAAVADQHRALREEA
jgi:hypothetical protein